MDIFAPQKRSSIMSRIRSKNSRPELIVRHLLHKMGFRFRLHVKKLPGHPDIVLPKWRCVIFVNGCFWHRHPDCKNGMYMPNSNQEFWKEKFDRNIKRDAKNWNILESMGWHVITVWECETKKSNLDKLRKDLFDEIVGE